MSVLELIKKNRSFRRFREEELVSKHDLTDMIEAARLCPSGRNAQSLKYYLVNDSAVNTKVFSTLSWAGYLKGWGGPVPGERPAAYIVIVNDTDIATNYFCDHGIVSMAILLTAVEKGLGGCIIASVDRPSLREALSLSERYDILLVIALGKPLETVVIEPLPVSGDYKYWRDENQVHHVPKRSTEDLILN